MINVENTPIQGVIFDVDGTIIDSMDHQFEWLKIAARKFDGNFKWKRYGKKFQKDYTSYLETHGMKGLYIMIGVDFEKHRKEIWDEYTNYNRTVIPPLIPDIASVIREIHDRSRVSEKRRTALRLALNTTKSWDDIEIPLTNSGILSIVDCVVTKNDVYDFVSNGEIKKKNIQLDDYKAMKTVLPEETVKALEKPNGFSAMLACYRLGVHPTRILAVEDTSLGIKSYRNVIFPDTTYNIAVAGVTYGGYESEERLRTANPDYLRNTPAELKSLIVNLGGLN